MVVIKICVIVVNTHAANVIKSIANYVGEIKIFVIIKNVSNVISMILLVNVLSVEKKHVLNVHCLNFAHVIFSVMIVKISMHAINLFNESYELV